jgi:hypothetical protein
MGHCIEGLVVPAALVAAAREVSVVVALPLDAADLSFIPMTDQLFDFLAERTPSSMQRPYPEFWKLSGAGVAWLHSLSIAGRVAYIETEYFGGTGAQAAAVWESGNLIFGPEQSEMIGPVDRALALLGVKSAGGRDEFDVAGLRKHRSNERWLELARDF